MLVQFRHSISYLVSFTPHTNNHHLHSIPYFTLHSLLNRIKRRGNKERERRNSSYISNWLNACCVCLQKLTSGFLWSRKGEETFWGKYKLVTWISEGFLHSAFVQLLLLFYLLNETLLCTLYPMHTAIHFWK